MMQATVRYAKLVDGFAMSQGILIRDKPALALRGGVDTRGSRGNNQKNNQRKQKATHNWQGPKKDLLLFLPWNPAIASPKQERTKMHAICIHKSKYFRHLGEPFSV
jgi:hypothetical protein